MPNKHFCQGPYCHQRTTQDRFLKSRGVIRGRYALWSRDQSNEYSARAKYFCSTSCESSWLDVQMEHDSWNGGTYKTNTIERVDNRTELE